MSDTSDAFKGEPDELQRLVLSAPGVAADLGAEGFVRHRFWRPFRYSIKAAGLYGFAFSGLSVLVIAAGLASSVLAAAPGQRNDTVVAILGLVVAVAAAINRLWRPGLRAVVRSRTANALRREGWDFVIGRGRYAAHAERDRWAVFVDEVQRINMIAEVVDEETLEGENEDKQ